MAVPRRKAPHIQLEGEQNPERNDPEVDKLIDEWRSLKEQRDELSVAVFEAEARAIAAMEKAGIDKSPGHATHVQPERTYTDYDSIEAAVRARMPATWKRISKSVLDKDAMERHCIGPNGKALTRLVAKNTVVEKTKSYLKAN